MGMSGGRRTQSALTAGAGLAMMAAIFVAVPRAAAAPAQPAAEQSIPRPEGNWYLHLGGGALLFDEGAVIRTGGAVIPKATVAISANATLIAEFGYRWRHWGLSLTGGFPPVATVDGAGSLAPIGPLGRIRYGPVVVSGHYHFARLGRLQPYVGGGPVFLLILRNEDDAVRHLDVRDSVGVAAQAGADYVISRRWGLFADVKKARLRTRATAALDDAPINAHIRLDPLVISAGLAYRF